MNVETIRNKFASFDEAHSDWMNAANRGNLVKPKVNDFVSEAEADFWLDLPLDVRFPEDGGELTEDNSDNNQIELFA